MECKICNDGRDYPKYGFHVHLKNKHMIRVKEYYNMFFKKENEGICHNKNCFKETTFKNINVGYFKYCSTKCSRDDEDVIRKIEDTCTKKYGAKSPFESVQIVEKIKDKVKEKYGVDNVFQSDIIKKKAKKTKKEKYGNENYSNNEKYKQTMFDKYGSSIPMHVNEIRTKHKNTCIEKYGVDNVFKSEKIKK